MSTEAALLGLISAARATPLAIIYGLLLAPRPGRLLLAYTASGVVISLVVGIAVVAGFQASAPTEGSSTTRLVIDLVLGIAALAYAAASAAGWSRLVRTREPRGGSWSTRLRDPSALAAGTAGAVTNLPGLFYIAGLVAIVQTEPTLANGIVQVLVYNALRFAVPVAAWLCASLDPARTRRVTDRVHTWGVRNSRYLGISLATIVGVYLTIKGLSGLGAFGW